MTFSEFKAELEYRVESKQEILETLDRRRKDYHINEGELIAYMSVIDLLDDRYFYKVCS